MSLPVAKATAAQRRSIIRGASQAVANWPNKRKLNDGRSPVPQPVKFKGTFATYTDVAALRALLQPHWPRPERVKKIPSPESTRRLEEMLAKLPENIREKLNADGGDDRSKALASVYSDLIRADYSD